MVLYLVDAHTDFQAGLDVERVASEGYAGIIVKATQGASGFTAPAAFDDWIRRALARGMVPGAYHWLTNASASSQLDHFLGRIGSPAALLCAVDVEDDSANAPSWATLEAFVAGWRERTADHPLILYSSNWWWSKRGWNGTGLTPYLWDSQYVIGSDVGSALYSKVPAGWWAPRYGGWNRSTLLQFTSSARVAGKSVDVSAFEGTRQELASLAGLEVDMQLDWGWTKPSPDITTPRGDGLLLAEAWRILQEGKGIYDAPDAPKGSYLAQSLEALKDGVTQLLAARDAETARDALAAAQIATMAAAIDTLVSAVNAGGTGTPLDSAAIMAAIEQAAQGVHQDYLAAMERDRAALAAALGSIPPAIMGQPAPDPAE